MPIIKSAKKKMRKDKKRTEHNAALKTNLKSLLKNARRTPTADSLSKITSTLDKAVKVNFIHKNQAARLNSRLAKLVSGKKPVKS